MIFKYLAPDEFEQIQEYFELLSFPRNALIIKQGDIGKGLYIIKQGKVSVVTHALCLGDVVLAELGQGIFIGETSLFGEQPSSASVRAIMDTETYFLSNTLFHGLRALYPLLADKLIKAIVEMASSRIREKLLATENILKKANRSEIEQFIAPIVMQGKDHPIKETLAKEKIKSEDPLLSIIFQDFSIEDIDILLSFMSWVEVEPKTMLSRIQETDIACYFTLAGAALGFVEAGATAAKFNVYGPGDILGQVDFIDEKARSLSVITREPSQFLKMTLAQKQALKEKHPILWSHLHYHVATGVTKMLYLTNQLLMRLTSESSHV